MWFSGPSKKMVWAVDKVPYNSGNCQVGADFTVSEIVGQWAFFMYGVVTQTSKFQYYFNDYTTLESKSFTFNSQLLAWTSSLPNSFIVTNNGGTMNAYFRDVRLYADTYFEDEHLQLIACTEACTGCSSAMKCMLSADTFYMRGTSANLATNTAKSAQGLACLSASLVSLATICSPTRNTAMQVVRLHLLQSLVYARQIQCNS
mmetsp:Transcript_13175/g.24657  ORF Transcript_13175/g.24657 Transcript_13175/m.24657 type:complete len:203 (-) Transcript_13175:2753-3361(-)